MPLEQVQLRPIGYVQTPYTSLAETPIQTSRNPDEPGRLVLLDQYAAGLDGLEGFDYVHLVCFLDQAWEADGRGTRPFVGDRLRPVPFLLQDTGGGSGSSPPAPPSAPTTSPSASSASWPSAATPSTSPGSTCSTAPRSWTSSRSNPTWTCPATGPAPAGSTRSAAAGTSSTTPPPTP